MLDPYVKSLRENVAPTKGTFIINGHVDYDSSIYCNQQHVWGIDKVSKVVVAFNIRLIDHWSQIERVCNKYLEDGYNIVAVRLLTSFGYKDIQFDYHYNDNTGDYIFKMVKIFDNDVVKNLYCKKDGMTFYQQLENDLFIKQLNVRFVEDKIRNIFADCKSEY